ncbi:hypothetical protein [Indioceanicola profundi]|uniref:hypothetical protein n=1 Tax=Indioceanicola profundi TaxID=2220096 RepID=UPI000E6AAEA4|nr:hypothetical protein [Indioceanicola profundi]
MPHIVLDITAHGLGHLAQMSPVMAALAEGCEPVRLTVRSGHPRETLARFIAQPFDMAPPVAEIGMAMRDPNRVDAEASRRFYLDLHADWDARVEGEAARLAALAPSLLLANVPYLSLAAADRAGVPAIALCSLNWRDVVGSYLGREGGMAAVLDRMHAAYRTAQPFIRFDPALPMADLPNAVTVGPVARIGLDRRAELRGRFPDAVPDTRFVLVSFGGIQGPPLIRRLPRLDRIGWIVSDGRLDREGRDDILTVEETRLSFIDLVRSADLVVTKPGYGLFADAVCNGVRLLHFGRPDWPETPYLAEWAARHGVALGMEEAEVHGSAFAGNVHAALAMTLPGPPPAPTGGVEAARIIAGRLGLRPRV